MDDRRCGSAIVPPSNRARVQRSYSPIIPHRVAPIRAGNMSLRSSASCSVLLIFRNGLSPFFCFPHHFIGQPSFTHDRKCLAASRAFQSRNSFHKKKDRAAIAGGPSQGRKRPGEGSDSGGGAIACLILQIKKPGALMGLNFCLRFYARASHPAWPTRSTPADHVGCASCL
jgi:hypothetical protein